MKLALFLLAVPLFAQNAALPTTLLNPTVPTITGTNRTVCASGCDFTTVQAAVTAATCGDGITITAGQTFSSASEIVLPNKACIGSILIRSSAFASLPATGVRVNCSGDLANMPKLVVTTNNTPVFQNDYTNGTPSARAAHDYYILGMEMVLGASITQNFGLVILDDGGSLLGVPTNITLDRNCIHPDHIAVPTVSDFVRGVTIKAGSRIAVINNYIAGFSAPTSGNDSQAFLVCSGPGPGLLKNNYLDAASENFMFGGCNDGLNTNQVADWEISYNYIHKQAYGAGHVAKNGTELKTAQRIWVHDNVATNLFNNSDQTGACFVLSNRPSQSGYGNTLQNVTIQGNICRHIGQAVTNQRTDQYCGVFTSIVNTSGTNFTITSGTQGDTNWGLISPIPATVNGVANTVTGFSDTTHGTLSASAGTQTGVVLQSVYSECSSQSNITVQNNLFEDVDNTYNGGLAVAYMYFVGTQFYLFDHNTMIPGVVMSIDRGFWGGTPSIGCVGPIFGYYSNTSITSNISLDSNAGMYADCYSSPAFFTAPMSVSGALTNNLVAGGIPAPEQTSWNTVGSANQFPANYAAIGLIGSNKALSSMSTYIATGAGANVLCLDETAVTNGTVASTSCVGTVTGGSKISGVSRISGRVVIH